MRTRAVAAVLAGLGLGGPIAGVLAEPPRLVRATPDHGDVGVDASITRIRLEFDQDMRSGRSICGGGEHFPEITGAPEWESPRVLVIPVKLLTGREYRFGVNCPSAQNFRGVNGEPAVISPMLFRTAPQGASVEAIPLTPEMNLRAVEALRRAIDTGYSYKARVVKDWDGALAPYTDAMINARTRAGFAREAARALEPARDPHISVRVGDAAFPVFAGDSAANYDLRRLGGVVKNLTRENDVVWTGEAGEKTAYVAILSWSGDTSLVTPAREAILEAGRQNKNLILDVRMNGGGDELTARAIAGLFAKAPTVYSRNRLRDPKGEGGWTPVSDRLVSPDAQHYGGRVAVLMGPHCMSSNESFLLMMRHAARATLVGGRSFGSSGRPMPHDLGNGVSVVLPSWVDLTPDGREIEGVGIEPDLAAVFDPDAPGDTVINAGVRHIEESPGPPGEHTFAASITGDTLLALVRELPTKRSASGGEEDVEGLRRCEELVLAKLRALGYEPTTHAFEWATPWRGAPGEDSGKDNAAPREWRNIIAEIPGGELAGEVLVLSAHLDAVTGAPGADDDGSGVAGLLEIARVYRERLARGERPRRTVRLCFFNVEEGGVVGSTRYAASIGLNITHGEKGSEPRNDTADTGANPRSPRIVGMVSLEMLGFFSDEPGSQKSPFAKVNGQNPPSVGDSIVLMTLAKYSHFCGLLADGMRRAEPELKVTRVDSLPLPVPDFLRSDHRAFALAGVPGIMMTDTANYRNPNYHKPTDTVETLDPVRYPRVVRATASAWWSLACAESLDPPAK